ncbi:tyrosine-type recombinase/integrase [Sphingomonas jinjuensis]|uniref:tyrosine-type recombinase/integrase n=1 Tax=Sphingomonas jinjuensis TaxID=535907 RepID=UPI00161FB12A
MRDQQSQATVQGCDQRGRDPCSLSGSRPSGGTGSLPQPLHTIIASDRGGANQPLECSNFRRRAGGALDGFWRAIRTDAALPGVRLHDLRHSFASFAARRSETLPMIGKLLGHAKAESTSRYAHLDDGSALHACEPRGDTAGSLRGPLRVSESSHA